MRAARLAGGPFREAWSLVEFATFWIVLGLMVLIWSGIEDTVTSVMLECQTMDGRLSRTSERVYCALCLTLLVLAWPAVLVDLVSGGQER